MKYFFIPASIVKKIELSDLADWLKVPCPCGKLVFFIEIPVEGMTFKCPCGVKIQLFNHQGEWVTVPENNEWIIEPSPCKCCFS